MSGNGNWGPPQLPELPPSFGTSSPFPPIVLPSRQQGQPPSQQRSSAAKPPPLPPHPPGALEREKQMRHSSQQMLQNPQHQSYPSTPGNGGGGSGGSGSGFKPGQLVGPPVTATPPPSFRMSQPQTQYGSPMAMPGRQQQQEQQYPPAGFAVGSPPAMPGGFYSPASPLRATQQRGTSPSPGRLPRPTANGPLQSLTSSMDELNVGDLGSRRASGSSEGHAYNSGGRSYDAMPNASSSSSAFLSTPRGSASGPPSLNMPLPDLAQLGTMREKAMASGDERRKLRWAKQVIKYVERKHDGNKISEAALVSHIDEAITQVINPLAEGARPNAEALFLRGDLLASGSFPSYHRKDLRSAFNDFELSARMGHAPSWFRIGRDYEVLGDMSRAKDAYERGCSVQDVGCVYRMGMANLLGQLQLPQDKAKAIALLREAADGADEDTPQPAYIYGMLLAGEFSHVEVPPQMVQSLMLGLQNSSSNGSSSGHQNLEAEARKRIERAAYLNFAPAQYKCGWCYEYAQLECSFDPLLSVQYYSLASQGGEIEADMALSKWFLCGAEGCFEKNESLAFTFAEKAARKQLPSAEFALAYYFEVGVGCNKDLELAAKWYRMAKEHGNEDAKERLDALAAPQPHSLSRQEHEGYIDVKLQRKRTEAKMISDRRNTILAKKRNQRQGASENSNGDASNHNSLMNDEAALKISRRKTMKMVEETAGQQRRGRKQDPSSTAVPPLPSPTRYQTAEPVQYQSERRPSGFNAAPPMPMPQQQQQQQPQPHTPTRLGTGGPPPRAPSPRPTPPRQQPQTSYSSNHGGSDGVPIAEKPASASQAKVYESFSEMGFAAKPVKNDKDCIIM